MRFRHARLLVIAVGMVSASASAAPFVEGPTRDGSAPFGPAFSAAIGINATGVAVGVSAVSNYAQRVVRYSANGSVDLPALSVAPGNTTGGGFSNAAGVSDDGIVIGTSRRYNGTTFVDSPGVYWDAQGTIHLLTPPEPPAGGRSQVLPRVISRNGIIGAESSTYNASNALTSLALQRYADASGAPTSLATSSAASPPKVYANGINRLGTIVGHQNANGPLQPSRWSGSGTGVETLAQLEPVTGGGARGSVAAAINDSNIAVGYSYHYIGALYRGLVAVRWNDDGSATALQSLGVSTDGNELTSATLINSAGDIAGTSATYNGSTRVATHGVRWVAGATTPTVLGSLGTSPSSNLTTEVRAMNDAGTIVGSSTVTGSSVTRATLWTRDSNDAIDLNTLIWPNANWTLTRADAINETGWIAGLGSYDPDGPGGQAAYGRLFSVLVPAAGSYGRGDANFDTAINFADLLLLAQHYGQTNTALSVNVADLNLDGSVNFSDLLKLAQHYGEQGGQGAAVVDGTLIGATFAADWALARSLVPEPAFAGSMCAVACATIRRQRHAARRMTGGAFRS